MTNRRKAVSISELSSELRWLGAAIFPAQKPTCSHDSDGSGLVLDVLEGLLLPRRLITARLKFAELWTEGVSDPVVSRFTEYHDALSYRAKRQASSKCSKPET